MGAAAKALAAGLVDHPARHGTAVRCQVIVGRRLAAGLGRAARQIVSLAFGIRKLLEHTTADRLGAESVVNLIVGMIGGLSYVEHLVLPFVPMLSAIDKTLAARRVHMRIHRAAL